MAFKTRSQKGEHRPNPTNTTVDGKRAATGNDYPDNFFVNPWNAGLDSQYGDTDGRPNETRSLFSPTSQAVGLHTIEIHEGTSYDSNWEYGTRGKPYDPPGPKSSTRWTPRGGGKKRG